MPPALPDMSYMSTTMGSCIYGRQDEDVILLQPTGTP